MPAKKISVTLNKPQGQFLQMKHKFRGFVGGYGSSKTYSGGIAMCQHFYQHPRINQGYFAPTYPHIRDIFFPTIEEVAFKMGLDVEIKEGNKEVHFYSGKKFRGTTICRSMEKAHTIVGFKIGHALIDEFDVLPFEKAETAWRKIIARMRYNVSGLKNGIDVTTTPEGFKYTHKLFVELPQEKPELKENYGLIQASTYDNEMNLPDDYIPSLIESYPEELIQAYLKGQFVNLTAGTVYRNYDKDINNSNEYIKEKEPLYIGMDFNVSNMSAVICVKRECNIHAVDELIGVYDTPDMIRIIKERWQDHGHQIYVYPDASGGARKTVDASISDLALLERAGFIIRARSANPPVKDRVISMNNAFEKCRLFINRTKCKDLSSCLLKLAYDKNGEPDKKSGFDHRPDALGYHVYYEMPVYKPGITTTFDLTY